MLLQTGVAVVGLCVACPEAAYGNAAAQLCKVLHGMAHSSGLLAQLPSQQVQQHAQLLLHLDTATRKQSLRELSPGSSSTTDLKPCELSFSHLLQGLTCIAARCAVIKVVPASHTCIDLDILVTHMLKRECSAPKSATVWCREDHTLHVNYLNQGCYKVVGLLLFPHN